MNKPLIYLGCTANLGIFNFVCEQNNIRIHGIVDNDYWGNTAELQGIPVVGGEASFDFASAKDHYNFFIASSVIPAVPRDRVKRLAFIELVNQHKLNCQTLIDPAARVCKGAVVEQGCFVGFQAAISYDAVMKAHSQVNAYASIGHHSILGQNSVLERRAMVISNVEIGDNVHIGAGVICVNHSGIVIGDNSEVHPGIVLMRDVEPNEVVYIGGKNSRRIYKNVIRD